MHRPKFESGDTIVEVLLSMAVLALIMVGAYVTVNRSILSERDAQEHTEALTIAQTQVEDLYRYGNHSIKSNGCFDKNLTPEPSTNCYVANDNISAGPTSKSSSNPVPAYYYAVTISNTSTSHLIVGRPGSATYLDVKTYTITVSWPSLFGGNNQVMLYYQPPSLS